MRAQFEKEFRTLGKKNNDDYKSFLDNRFDLSGASSKVAEGYSQRQENTKMLNRVRSL